MNIFSALAKLFTSFGKSKPKPQEQHEPEPPAIHEVHISVWQDGAFPAELSGSLRLDDEHVTILPGNPIEGRLHFYVPADAAVYTNGATLTTIANGAEFSQRIILAPDVDVEVPSAKKLAPARPGVTRLIGKAWADDGGPYYPFYSTMLWAVGGIKRGERDRVIKNYQYLKSKGCDGVRILAQVGWPGESFDSTDEPQFLAEAIDLAYAEGLKVKLTLVGGGARDVHALAQAVRSVVESRREKVFLLEAVNEGNASAQDAIDIVQILKPLGLPIAIGLGNQGIDAIKGAGEAAGASVDILHPERGGDNNRNIRQAWDFHVLRRAAALDDGEPAGPGSSVAEVTDAFTLAMMRLMAIVCGAGSFCLHTGSGVYGRAHRSNNGLWRPANIWEVQNIDDIFAAVASVTQRLPIGVENWVPYNTNLSVELASGGCDKHYGCRTGRDFIQVASGCAPGTSFKSKDAVSFKVYHPVTGEEVATPNNLPGYLIIGQTA